jgi:hypothetical protein
MESLSSIIAEQILPYTAEKSVHIRLSIQNKILKRKRFNYTKDIYVPYDKIPYLLERLETTKMLNGGMYIIIDKVTGQPRFGASAKDMFLEEELKTLFQFPFTGLNCIKPDHDSILNKTFVKSSLIYIVFSR